jgi:transposase
VLHQKPRSAADAAQKHGIQLEVVKYTEAKRSFAWAARFRRLARDYERLSATLAGLHYFVFAGLMIGKLFKLLNGS